ncbi:MAG TPA: CCA tRNA nucleotidyltransferase [Nitrososphaera sp.]|nr:CCA tRNA nucleotidyltransferase [Nitrososphaera sp.]
MTDTIIQAVLAKALALCSPTASEEKRLSSIAEDAKRLVEQRSRAFPEVRGVLFAGSFAKGTWLRGDADVDIFIKMDPSVSEEKFEQLGIEIGMQALKKYGPKLRYSDHPYVEATVRGTRINVVPCYDVQRGQWKSAADRSPFHTQYIMEALDAAKKEQVRLLKKFLKSADIYGAEISTAGFSGYVSEVLIAKFGSFERTLAAAAEFRHGQVISVMSSSGGSGNGYDEDVVKGFSSPLIIIDPVDPRRNLGTAVSPESAGKMMLAARAFLHRPSPKFFIARQKMPNVNKKLYGNVLVVEFSHRERSPDTVWGQLKRSANSLAKQLELAGFTVYRSACNTDEKRSGAFAFLLESLVLPEYTMRRGPEIARAKETESFVRAARPLAMWADREMRVSTIVKRKATDARQLIKTLLDRPEANGIARDMITGGKVKIYSGKERGKFSGLVVVKQAVDELVSTESLIFSFK